MPEIAAFGFMGSQASQGLFGANVLATRSSLEQGGDYDRLIEELGVGSFRYPGGSLTERYFDITDPNASVVTDRDTGELRDFIPLNEALAYAGEEGLSVTIVIPTRNLLSDTADANGDRFAAIDEDALRGFVRDVVNGVHGDAEIEAFELGNEYWGSGQMSSVEYGRLASEMAVIVNDELDAQGSGADIIVQSGANFNFARLNDQFSDDMSGADIIADLNASYGLNLGEDSLFSSGEVNWTQVANEMILSEFDTEAEQQAVDQVAVHVYSRGQVNEGQRSFFLNTTDETWGEQMPDAQIAVTEWNTAGNTGSLDRNSDYGLYQSHEMINIMEEFLRYDVEQAHVWPLIQNTPNTLSVDDGQADLTPGGAMFNMMQEALPGKVALDLTPEAGADTEVEEDGIAVHGFWEPDELLFYVAATQEGGADTSVDFSGLVSDTGRVEISVLGVAEGAAAGSNASDAVVEDIDPATLLDGTMLSVQMDEGEIMQVRMFGFTPSEDFQNVISDDAPEALPEPMIDPFLEESAVEDGETEFPFPTVAATAGTDEFLAMEEAEALEDSEAEDDEGGMEGLGDLIAALPILGLMALFM
ncbi:type I secretion protein [uncultured Marivita sp.]|uniref:type I secretion protein n=1 Tax=uncultured Marivita sp. TaxID=888080 RepID=UPI0026325344|nr:type I secretion protein [uncultured Marivita sp.]